MTETGIVAIVGIGATLFGTLFAAWWSSKSAMKLIRTERGHEIQDSQRAAIVEVLKAGRTLRDMIMVGGTAHCSAPTAAEAERWRLDHPLPVGGDSPRDALREAATAARLIINNEELRDAVTVVANMATLWFQRVLEPNEASYAAGETQEQRFDRVRAFDRLIRHAFAELERITRETLIPKP